MIHAYDKTYLEKARVALGRMFDFAVYELRYDLEDFWKLFISSGVADRFGEGDFRLLAGKSGVEIVYEVLDKSGIKYEVQQVSYTVNRSREYWLGWALAYYQWNTSIGFDDITRNVPLKDILTLYSPYHEMDILQFVDKMNQLYKEKRIETNLKMLRKKAGYSQREIADLTGIPVRTIQQYEQQQKDINKAQAAYLIRMSGILHCRVEDLIEKIR